MINLTIDGIKVSVPKGTTVLKAAQLSGIEIPTLCDHPELTPYGGCRLCVVEIEGSRTLQTSCTMPVMENMVVKTDTAKVRDARKFILTMIFSDRNHFCPFCVVNDGDCELQQVAYKQEMTHWPIQPNWKPYSVDASHPNIVIDHNRCILCRRCVRVCSELVGNYTLGIEERGANSLLMADLGTPLGESSCVSCGACVQVCPTGAIIDRWSANRGQTKNMQTEESICIGCSIECGVTVFTKDNHLVKIDGDWKAQPNNGLLCKIGRFIPLDEQRERLQTPLVRKDGQLTPASWEEAASVVTAYLSSNAVIKENSIAGLVSTRLPLEAICQAKELFGTALHSPVTSIDEGKYSALTKLVDRKLGVARHNKLEDIDKADLIVLLNANLTSEHEVASFLVKRSVASGARLLVIGSVENALESIAELSLRVNPKVNTTDILDGLTAALQKEGLNKIASNGIGDGALENAALSTAIPVETYLKAAKLLGSADKALIIYGYEKKVEEAPELAEKIIHFAHVSGAKAPNWSGLLSMKGKANSYAAALYDLDQPILISSNQVVYVAIGDEEPTQRLLNLVDKNQFLVVQAAYNSKLTAMADVVLPTVIWGEEEGHYLNINGEIKKSAAFLTAAPAVKTNYEILTLLAGQLKIQDSLKQDWQSALKNASVQVVA